MPILNRWNNPEKTILCQYFEGNWEIDELIDSFAEVMTMLDSVAHPVNVIADLSSGKTPTGFLPRFSDIRDTTFAYHPNTDRFFLVANSRFIEMMAKTFSHFSKLISGRLFIVNTIEEAYDILTNCSFAFFQKGPILALRIVLHWLFGHQTISFSLQNMPCSKGFWP